MITMDDAILHLRKAVADKGEDFVYTPLRIDSNSFGCRYVHNDEPSCLVGHALVNQGVTVQSLIPVNSEAAIYLGGMLPKAAITSDAAFVFQAAQAEQDRSRPWGVALAAAEKKYRELGGEL